MNRETISQVDESVCFYSELSDTLGEILGILGVYGHLEVRSARARGISREFVSGSVHDGRYQTDWMVNNAENIRAQLEETAVFLSELDLKDPNQIILIIRITIESGLRGQVVISRSISEKAIGVLYATIRQPQKFRVIAIKIPGSKVTEQSAFLEYIAILTGSKTQLQLLGASLEKVEFEDLG